MELHEGAEPIAQREEMAQNLTEESQPVEAQTAEATEATEAREEVITKASLLEALREIAAKDEEEFDVDRVGHIKQQFYALHNEQLRQAREQFVAEGGNPEEFAAAEDAEEEAFKAVLNEIKEKKASLRARKDAEMQANYERKRAIVDEIAALSADMDNVGRHYPRVKELQAEFKAIGEVLPTQSTEIWKTYQDAVEHFYDQWKVNKELRDYDFKKNLEEKQLLLEEAVKLADEQDVLIAFRRLQDLHDKWREIGPVAKDVREELWAKFKDASAVVNKRYQAFFEERKKREKDNEDGKTAICERVEALDFSGLATVAAWNAMTEQILAAQEDWKKLGFASRKVNNQLFERFRKSCDAFFAAKAEFFKSMKESHATNLAKKIQLCEEAESLKDSTEWKKTSDRLVELQKAWRAVGPVPKKHSDAIWARFLAACDYFFEKKKATLSGARKVESDNLKVKLDIIAELNQLNSPEATTPREDAIKRIHELRALWQQTGHVPFKEKDRLYDTYRAVVGELFEKYDIHENRARMASFESNVAEMATGDGNKLYRERERLARIYEQRRNELQNYENNLGFFNTKSKSGEQMLKEMERKIQRIKEDLKDLEKKITIIDQNIG